MPLLDSCFNTLVRWHAGPSAGPTEIDLGTAMRVLALVALVMALPAAGVLGTGALGALGTFLLVYAAILGCWFWTGAGIGLLAKLAGGRGTLEATMVAVAEASWPLILAPIAAGMAQFGWESGANLLLGLLCLGALLTAVDFVRRVHDLSWGKAATAWLTLLGISILSGIAAFGALGLLLGIAAAG